MGANESKTKSSKRLDLVRCNLTKFPDSVKEYSQLNLVNIAGNNITSIPQTLIKHLVGIKMLNWSHNKLQKLPEAAFRLTNLETLDLGWNCLSKLPVDLGKLKKMKRLDLRDNQIRKLPTTLINLKSLRVLYLTQNRLETFPPIKGLKALEELYLDVNFIHKLPKQVLNTLSGLKKFTINYNQLKVLDDFIFSGLDSLTEFELHSNDLSKNIQQFACITTLRLLNLSDNQLTNLNSNFGELGRLERLELQRNQLNVLPQSLKNLNKSLKYFNLSNNKFQKFPKSLCFLTNLNKLILKSNQISKITNNNIEWKLNNLNELIISNNNLQILPMNFFQYFPMLRYLDLSHNQLSTITDSIKTSKHLQHLLLNNNELIELNDKICKVHSLLYLNICNNKLEKLPGNFGNLINLRILIGHDNSLSQLPDSFEKLINLQILNLALNKFIYFPKSMINKLSNLKIIQMAHNNIKWIPNSIIYLSKLEEVDFSCNNLYFIPKAFGHLLNLYNLRLSGNRIKSLPSRFFKFGNKYFFNNNNNIYFNNNRQNQNLINNIYNYNEDGNEHQFINFNFNQNKSFRIELAFNLLKRINPNWRKILTRTSILDLSHNQIPKIPEHILRLGGNTRIQIIKFEYNQCSRVDFSPLLSAQKLSHLHVEGNSIKLEFKKLLQNLKKQYELKHKTTATNYNNNNDSSSSSKIKNNNNDLIRYSFINNQQFVNLQEIIVDNLVENSIARIININSQKHNIGYSQSCGNSNTLEHSISVSSEILPNTDLVFLSTGHGGNTEINNNGKSEVVNIVTHYLPKFLIEELKDLCLKKNSKIKNHYHNENENESGNVIENVNQKENKNKNEHENENGNENENENENEKLFNFTKNEMKKVFLKSFKRTNQIINKKENIQSGASVAVIVINEKKIHCANLGDVSITIIKSSSKTRSLSKKHSPNQPQEKKRIKQAGGVVSENGRINNLLAVSRAFGDVDFDRFLSRIPYTNTIDIENDDRFVIIASESINTFISGQEMANIVLKNSDPFFSALKIRTMAYSRGGTINVSVCVVDLLLGSSYKKNKNNFYELTKEERIEKEQITEKIKKEPKIDFEQIMMSYLNQRKKIGKQSTINNQKNDNDNDMDNLQNKQISLIDNKKININKNVNEKVKMEVNEKEIFLNQLRTKRKENSNVKEIKIEKEDWIQTIDYDKIDF
ncbi:leucine-rich repeat protein soc-2 homolog-like protein [Anaeramoeba flamelloides]|uniref:Leucine-rich repeat protein soc-2 homolog-like protein n=1 Tax=Anaeramoeba flamelloides TaxID=1746091 RepID=A0ABQ8YAK6_9EUKA|nr:leucine-rich repeat protein soc-2 homolog-like protein [Anaeramoeba flamelloides]